MKSEKVTDIFGNEKVVHYDDYGNKVGESQVERGFLGFGEERVVHYDANGNKTGESRQEKDFFGNDKVVHYDDYGIKTGESRQENGFLGLGEDRTVHYDDRGHKVSQTFTEKDFFGNEKQVTYDSYSGAKIGQYTDETPYYSRKVSGDASGRSTYGGGSSVDYSGYHEVHVPTLTAKDAAWLLSTFVLTVLALAVPFILYIALKNSGGAINLIRTAVTALCPVATLFSIIMYRAKKTDGETVRTGKRRMIISTFVLFAVQEAIFLAYTAPAANGDKFSSFLMFVCCWIPKLIYSVVCGIFSRKCHDGGNTCDGCYFFAAKAFAIVAALMETVNVIADGILGEFFAAVLYTVPAALILYGVIMVLSKGTDWIYKKISR